MHGSLARPVRQDYIAGCIKKIRAAESLLIKIESEMAVFVISAGLVLRPFVATTALVDAALLVKDDLDVLVFYVSAGGVRLYAPLEGTPQDLTAIIGTNSNIERMNEMLVYPVQTGSEVLTTQGCDVVFDHVGFSYQSCETFLRNVSFTTRQGQVTALVGHSGGVKTTVSVWRRGSGTSNGSGSPWAAWTYRRSIWKSEEPLFHRCSGCDAI